VVPDAERAEAERDEALGVQDGHISAVQKVLEERRRAERAEADARRYREALEWLADDLPAALKTAHGVIRAALAAGGDG